MAADNDRGRGTAGLRAEARLRLHRCDAPRGDDPRGDDPRGDEDLGSEGRAGGRRLAQTGQYTDQQYAEDRYADQQYEAGTDHEMRLPMRAAPTGGHDGSPSRGVAVYEPPPPRMTSRMTSRMTWHRRWMRRAGICAGSLATLAVLAAVGLWLVLANGPISIDLATPWIADAVAGNLGNGYHVDIGDTVLENDEHGRPAMRIRAITVRDHDGTVVASAPKAEVGFSGASLLSGHPRAQRLNLVGAELAVRVETDGRITLSTGAGDDPPLAVAPPPATDSRSAPLADGVAALTAGDGEAPRGVAEILAGFLAWVDSLQGLDGGDLAEVGLKSGNLVVDDRRNGQQSRFDNIHLILSRPSAGALEFELGSDDPTHPWLLLAAIGPGKDGGRSVDLDARQVLLKDVLLAARVDGGQIDTDLSLSTRIHADLSADGNPHSSSGRVELGAGKFGDSGDPRATIAIDSAQASFDWNAGERLLTLPFEVRSGRTRLTLTAQAVAPRDPGGIWTVNLANTEIGRAHV